MCCCILATTVCASPAIGSTSVFGNNTNSSLVTRNTTRSFLFTDKTIRIQVRRWFVRVHMHLDCARP